MWESRALCEISKSLWEALFAFHRDVISTAVFAFAKHALELKAGGCWTLAGLPITVPVASDAVVFDRRRSLIAHEPDFRRRRGTKGPGARPRREDRGPDAGGVGRDRSVR